MDVGCGIGYFTNLLSRRGSEVLGVDTDSNSIAAATRALGNKFLSCSAESLPFRDGSFDKVLCTEVLYYLPDDAKAIQEICRVARPGATVVVTAVSPDGLLGARFKHVWQYYRPGYTRCGLGALLEENGVEVVEVRYTLVALAALLMQAMRLAYPLISGNRQLDNQAEIVQMKDSWLWATYRAFFPIITLLARLEDTILAPWLKGQLLILKGRTRVL